MQINLNTHKLTQAQSSLLLTHPGVCLNPGSRIRQIFRLSGDPHASMER